jgi:hypothetical protein
VRNVAGDGRRQFDHAIDQGDIFLAQARHQAGTENRDDHAGGLSLIAAAPSIQRRRRSSNASFRSDSFKRLIAALRV